MLTEMIVGLFVWRFLILLWLLPVFPNTTRSGYLHCKGGKGILFWHEPPSHSIQIHRSGGRCRHCSGRQRLVS